MPDAKDAPESTYRFHFTGRAGDYFRIWVTSLLLSIVTLGVYSAWGKVRKRRYLYAHTELDGSGFEYRAAPLAILKGRIVALILFGGLAVAGQVLPLAQVALALVLILLTPWIVVASARFNARNSAWRNVTFGFDGRIGEAARVFLGYGALAIVTLGLGYPYFRMRRARYILAHHRFGATRFDADLETGGFVLTYLLAFLMSVGIAVLVAIALGLMFVVADRGTEPQAGSVVTFVPLAMFYGAYIGVYGYISARVGNLTLNGLVAGPLRGRGSLRARGLAWIYITNIVVVIATLGIATAWATIRVARYRAEHAALVGDASFAAFAGAGKGGANATGSEVSDLFDVDVSL